MARHFRFCIFSFLGGVAFASLFHFGIAFSFFMVFIGLIIFCVSHLSEEKTDTFIPLLILFFALGYLRIQFIPDSKNSLLKEYVGQQISIEGVIQEEPDIRENSARLIVDVGGEKLLIVARKYPEFEYGEKVRLQGKIVLPENFANDNGREFDYISYLAKDGIFYEMPFPKIETLGTGKGNPLIYFLYSVKKTMTEKVSSILPEPEGGLLLGLLFGAKRALSSDMMEMFRVAGIVHIVVLSGYNITIIADFFTRAFLLFPISKLSASFAGGIGVILFAVMSGLGASTLRAVAMALLVIFARATGRTADALHLLFIAAFFMVLWNPLSLLYDPSFQLSFLATLGLLCLGTELSSRFSFIPQKFGFRETLSATLSTQIFVLPLLLYETGMLSVVALPVNLIILPLLPMAMFFGSIATLLGFITPFGTFFGFPVFLLLSAVFTVASFFANLPFSSFSIPPFSVSVLIAIYFFYAMVYLVYLKKQNKENQKIIVEIVTESKR